jgi:hypothetical protein
MNMQGLMLLDKKCLSLLDAEVPGPAAAVQQDPAGPRPHLPPPHRGQAPPQGTGGGGG